MEGPTGGGGQPPVGGGQAPAGGGGQQGLGAGGQPPGGGGQGPPSGGSGQPPGGGGQGPPPPGGSGHPQLMPSTDKEQAINGYRAVLRAIIRIVQTVERTCADPPVWTDQLSTDLQEQLNAAEHKP